MPEEFPTDSITPPPAPAPEGFMAMLQNLFSALSNMFGGGTPAGPGAQGQGGGFKFPSFSNLFTPPAPQPQQQPRPQPQNALQPTTTIRTSPDPVSATPPAAQPADQLAAPLKLNDNGHAQVDTGKSVSVGGHTYRIVANGKQTHDTFYVSNYSLIGDDGKEYTNRGTGGANPHYGNLKQSDERLYTTRLPYRDDKRPGAMLGGDGGKLEDVLIALDKNLYNEREAKIATGPDGGRVAVFSKRATAEMDRLDRENKDFQTAEDKGYIKRITFRKEGDQLVADLQKVNVGGEEYTLELVGKSEGGFKATDVRFRRQDGSLVDFANPRNGSAEEKLGEIRAEMIKPQRNGFFHTFAADDERGKSAYTRPEIYTLQGTNAAPYIRVDAKDYDLHVGRFLPPPPVVPYDKQPKGNSLGTPTLEANKVQSYDEFRAMVAQKYADQGMDTDKAQAATDKLLKQMNITEAQKYKDFIVVERNGKQYVAVHDQYTIVSVTQVAEDDKRKPPAWQDPHRVNTDRSFDHTCFDRKDYGSGINDKTLNKKGTEQITQLIDEKIDGKKPPVKSKSEAPLIANAKDAASDVNAQAAMDQFRATMGQTMDRAFTAYNGALPTNDLDRAAAANVKNAPVTEAAAQANAAGRG